MIAPVTPPDEQNFWIAIQTFPDSPPFVIGPYTSIEAYGYRQEWLQLDPPMAKIGAAFRADTRSQAEESADQYLPMR